MLELLSTEFTPTEEEENRQHHHGDIGERELYHALAAYQLYKNDIAMSITVAARAIVFMKGSRRKTRSTPASG